jgi:SAM-dependent methyltransferase
MDCNMNFWDQQFAAAEFKYGTEVNQFLRQQAAQLPPGARVLLPGDGEGRNSVWLAQQGFQVTAMDSSRVGLDKAQRLAAQKGVAIETIHADLTDWVPTPAGVDAVVLTFVHLPETLRATVHQRLVRALRPGGRLILEAFHPLQLGKPSGGPKVAAMLFTLDLLRGDLQSALQGDLTEVLGWEGEDHLSEGPGHQGLAHLTRFVVRQG